MTSPGPGTPRSPSISPRSVSHSSSDPATGFPPGTMLADRYRIVGLLGRGGMGEVYRADDLTLGQAVALKFLPDEFREHPDRLERFYNEVRTARMASHPNLCRVFDIGEIDGRPYYTMEFVDGEDLASLLRRIGRLPQEKGLEIARQLCAGLAALHDRGILHRDLKPANIMIDGRGRVRITDFGLSAIALGLNGDERAGTPAYMSPEQLEGREVSPKSDLYALGLIFYELFTGRRAFEAKTLAEISRLHRESTPASPSVILSDFDPILERVITRCLEKDPARRPTSAISVAAALPGGDPLAAALAAGEVPSPEMVAAGGAAGGIRPAVGILLVVLTLVGLYFEATILTHSNIHTVIPMGKPP
ncbi:MAG TPA: serine/threonine-protein kinase, partial [bacterium]|nr:serine/threonine-protein kinase [bacterium]